MKKVMNKWEKRNNDAKEEVFEFGTDEGGEMRVLGSWKIANADASNWIKRTNGLWLRMKSWLIGSRLTERWQMVGKSD